MPATEIRPEERLAVGTEPDAIDAGNDSPGSRAPAPAGGPESPPLRPPLVMRLAEVNKELWLVLSMLALAAAVNHILVAQSMVLGLYSLPTIFAAFYRGRRYATLTAAASALLIGLMAYFNPALLSGRTSADLLLAGWYDLVSWGLTLILTAFAMGTLHERHVARSRELRQTYHGLLSILRQFLSNDKYTENHSYRVSIYAATIAQQLGLPPERIELVRAASLLHDLGKLEVSRQVLHKAARLSEQEYRHVSAHTHLGAEMLEPVSGSLDRILPIILAHHDHYDGSGQTGRSGREVPLEARIIAVADVYDALTSDRPYRKAMAPPEAREIILSGRGTDYDPRVVDAFQRVFARGQLEIPAYVV